MNAPVNILLVDDEVRNLDVLESFLQSADYNLVRALSGEEALLKLLDGVFAAIVLDIQMPGISGIELANLIKQRKRTQHIPIIFLTAYYQADADMLQGYGSGAVDYLTKPLNPQILKSKIAVFADLFRKSQALEASNAALELEIAQRLRAQHALQAANSELEARVRERTSDLLRVNQELSAREAALRASESEARAASRAKDAFLAILSHELRTPLNPVLLLATEGANNPSLDNPVRADFDTIAKNVALEARLIDDLLDLTHITHGKVVLDLRPFDVHNGLHHTLAMARQRIEEKKLELKLHLQAEQCLILGDEVRIKQVLWNIVINAAKFTPPGGCITIETANPAPDTLSVSVTDTGIGMTAEEQRRVFEAFVQGDHSLPGGAHYGGVGLGLAIARMMVKLHSGIISAKSEGRGHGTILNIQLPLLRGAQAAAIAETAPAIPESPAHGANGRHRLRRVLLVEDHASTAQALGQLLSRRQYEVLFAGSLTDARNIVRQQKFDLLISDIGLPDGTGYELMAELRGTGVVGIALTGYGQEQDVRRSRMAGFQLQLTKPISVQALDQALANLERLFTESFTVAPVVLPFQAGLSNTK